MAETVHLKLKANGNDIKGESSQHDLERQDSIECVEFRDRVYSAREKGSRSAVGRRVHDPIVFVKRVDSSSPLLAKALCNNEKIEGVFRFYRPSPTGDGTTEQFFTIEITNGRVDSIARRSPSAINPAESEEPFMEEVALVFEEITWTYEPKGVAHVDKWNTSG